MSDTDLCYMPATTALDLFKKRKLSPVELMKAVTAQAEKTEATVNAFTHQWFDEAMTAAQAAEQAYATGKDTGLLTGLPVGLKNELAYKDKPVDVGSHILKDHICTHSHPVTERVLAEGGIIHASTNVPEFCSAHFTKSTLHGSTATPWNPDYNSGGSSGGSAAALAAGSATLAIGSDIGGSIRIPASYCGIVGLKPAYGRLPEDPPFNLESYNHIGPMARTVADCALLLNATAGPHPKDIASIRPKMQLSLSYENIKGMRIAYSPTLDFIEIDPEVEKAMQAAVQTFRDLGAIVEEVTLNWGDWIKKACSARLSFMLGGWVRPHLKDHRDLMNDYLLKYLEELPALTAEEHLDAVYSEIRMYDTLGPVLDSYSALICPTSAVTGIPREISGHTLTNVYETLLTYPFNMLSRCPVLSVPAGFSTNGVPIGMQIVGRTYDEPTIFQIASNYEQETRWTIDRQPPLA